MQCRQDVRSKPLRDIEETSGDLQKSTGVSTCPQVCSMFKEGIWNAQPKTWEGGADPRTMEGDEANYTAFLLGRPSLQAASCSTQRILKLPRAWVVLCILHTTMAMGRLHNPRHVKVCKQPCHALCLHIGLPVDGRPRTTRHLVHPLHATAPPPPPGCCARCDHVSESGYYFPKCHPRT